MSITTLAYVRALVATDLGDATLQAIVDDLEAELLSSYGHPADPRTTTLTGGGPVLALGRPIASVASVRTAYSDAADAASLDPTSYQVYPQTGQIRRRRGVGPVFPSDYWNGEWSDDFFSESVVAWTPVDFSAQFRGVVIDLVRLTLARTAYQQENIGMGQLQYRQDDWEGKRAEIIARLATPGPRLV